MAQVKVWHPTQNDGKVYAQVGPTCWANAAAQTIISAEMRHGRKVSDHATLTRQLMKKYGADKGQWPLKILKNECKDRYFEATELAMFHAAKAVENEAVVCATYRFSDREWHIMMAFFEEYPKSVLTRYVFQHPEKYLNDKSYHEKNNNDNQGHAVVIIGYEDGIHKGKKSTQPYWKIKNSHGSRQHDNGYFRVLARVDQDTDGFPRTVRYYGVDAPESCPGRHGLKHFVSVGRHTCDECGTTPPKGTGNVYGCRKCDYDLCGACYWRGVHTRCPKRHFLVNFATPKDTFRCNGCNQRVVKGTVMFGCRKCNYDLCTACFVSI